MKVDGSWLAALAIGPDERDDPYGPFTPEECALGEALYERIMHERRCVAEDRHKPGAYCSRWHEVRRQFSWYADARELLRAAQFCLRDAAKSGEATPSPIENVGADAASGEGA